jgi:uncharacterized protein
MTHPPVMRQSWRDLLFLHFPCDPGEIAPLLPPGLEVDTFPDASGTERAWVGLVPFRMQGVRWTFAPPVPGAHAFPETNVRTYVRGGAGPGVWFFSLDAMNRPAVATARLAFALPYFFARMSVHREGDRILYQGRRTGADYRIVASLGPELPAPREGSRESFLVERYRLYAARGRRLWSGRVFHAPYGLRVATPESLEETLVRAAGIEPRPFVHALFSEGVDVGVGPLRRVS